jgi:hypothetical protein
MIRLDLGEEMSIASTSIKCITLAHKGPGKSMRIAMLRHGEILRASFMLADGYQGLFT